MRVTASALNVRSAPAQDRHNVIGGLHHGQVIEAKAAESPWLRVAFHDRDAFVHGHFVTPVAVAAKPAIAPHQPAPAVHQPAPVVHTPPPDVHAEVAEAKQAKDGKDAKDGAAAKPKPALSSGFSKSGGGSTRSVLTRLANTGKLKITPSQIAQLDAASQIESGGQIASVDTTDDQVVSIGFFQLVLGHKSIEAIMKKVPAAFAKYGLELDMTKTYAFASHPHQIKGVEDYRELRGHEWGDKFYAASNDDQIIVAMAEFALAEATNVQAITTAHGGTGDYFADDTARAWLLELHNNRPAYVATAVSHAVAAGARDAKDRDKFLDILAAAIEDSYEPEGVAMYHHAKSEKKNQNLTPEKDAELLAHMKAKARLKGTHI
ncbi:MAG TPA: SH3 domain-containing protein, partial [Kofleriaceae bacterium]|nr:SH3 domain-containing protein [Kofleriaceae bacterium]